jgi:hypothetical protein
MSSATGWSAMDRQAWGRGPHAAVPRYEPRRSSIVVVTDGSFANGVAGIAYSAPFGEHAETIAARNSTEAENAALLLAMHGVYRHASARGERIPKTDFVTDFNPHPTSRPDEIQRYLASYRQWKVVPVTRRITQPAHALAIRALRGAAA